MEKFEMFIQYCKNGLPILAALFLLMHFGCENSRQADAEWVEPARTGEVIIQNEPDQVEILMEGLQVSQSGMAYGIDFGRRLPYRLSLIDGSFEHLAKSGRGPDELSQPNQIYLINDDIQFVNDQAGQIAKLNRGEVTDKTDGFLAQGVWVRNTYGLTSNEILITAIKDQHINALNFNDVKPLYFWDPSTKSGAKKGKFSTTLDRLDSHKKYPLITIGSEGEYVYYVFNTDYSIFKMNAESGVIEATSRYRPNQHRERSIAFDHTNNYHFTRNFSREFNMDITNVTGIGTLIDKLVVVWHNANQNYYDNPVYDAENYNHFGVVYDLPDLTNPREFTLPRKFLGTWGNKLLIEENEDPLEYTIGFYEFE